MGRAIFFQIYRIPLGSLGESREVFDLPGVGAAFGGDFVEGFDFGFGEEEATGSGGGVGGVGFDLAGEEAFVVAMAEDVVEDRFEVAGLVASFGEGTAVHGVGMDDLEVERGSRFFSLAGAFAAAADGR